MPFVHKDLFKPVLEKLLGLTSITITTYNFQLQIQVEKFQISAHEHTYSLGLFVQLVYVNFTFFFPILLFFYPFQIKVFLHFKIRQK